MAASACCAAARGPDRRTSASDTEPIPAGLDREGLLHPITVTCDGRSGGPVQKGEPWVKSHTAKDAALWQRSGSGAASYEIAIDVENMNVFP